MLSGDVTRPYLKIYLPAVLGIPEKNKVTTQQTHRYQLEHHLLEQNINFYPNIKFD